MNQQQFSEALALIAKMAAGDTDETANSAVTSADSEQVRAATVLRQTALIDHAKPIAKDLWEAFTTGNLEFDAEVIAQMAWAGVSRARLQHFWSRNMADFQARQLAEEQERGYRYNRTGDPDLPMHEVNPVQQIENALHFHTRNMEQYEVLMYAHDLLWGYATSVVVAAGGQPGNAPNVDISEKEYANYVQGRVQQARQRADQTRQATLGAHQQLVRTQFHFIEPPAETSTEQTAT